MVYLPQKSKTILSKLNQQPLTPISKDIFYAAICACLCVRCMQWLWRPLWNISYKTRDRRTKYIEQFKNKNPLCHFLQEEQMMTTESRERKRAIWSLSIRVSLFTRSQIFNSFNYASSPFFISIYSADPWVFHIFCSFFIIQSICSWNNSNHISLPLKCLHWHFENR